MDPTLRQLEYAVAVADHLHFRRAAEACHVTQPALSVQIQQLEDLLGVRLFERGRRGVLVTPAGEEIVERARRTLSEVRELVQDAARWRAPRSGPLRVGVIPTVAPYLLPHLLPALRAARPDYELRLWEEQTAVLLRRLRAGEIDLLLIALPADGDDLAQQELGAEPFVLLAPRGHRLARHDDVTASDLAGEPVLLLEDGHCLRDQALEVCAGAASPDGPEVHANSLATLVQMVTNGLGVTLLPTSAMAVEVRRPRGLVVKRFREPAPSRRLGLVWRRGTARDGEYREIATLFAREIQRHLPRPTSVG